MMSHLRKKKSYLFTFLLTLGMIFAVNIFAAEPSRTLGFQGQFYTYNTPGNNPVNATFTFYDSVTGGNVTGTPISKIIQVVNGYFGTTFTEADTTGVDLNQQLYLEISINGTTLSPRTTVNPTVSSLKSFGTFSYTSEPTVGPSGSLYFNSTSNELYVSTGGQWQLAGVSSSTTQWVANGTSLNYMAGNVGIGTTTPTQKLTVSNGSIALDNTTSTTTGVIYKNEFSFLHNYGAAGSYARDYGENVFLGIESGNFTMPSYGAGGEFYGSYNTGVGRSTLKSLTSGYANTALGGHALENVSSGFANVGIGLNTLKNVTFGNNNIAINGGTDLTTGSGNILIAGNTTSTTSSNQLNIGNLLYATGLNTSTSLFGIGSSTPNGKLVVKGTGTGSNWLMQLTDSANTPRVTIYDNGQSVFNNIVTISNASSSWSNIGINNFGNAPLILGSAGSSGGVSFARSTGGNRTGFVGFASSTDDTEFRVSNASASGFLTFLTGTSGGTERMRIDPSGNISIGTSTATAKLYTVSTAEQLRLAYDSSNYVSETVNSQGTLTMNAFGTVPGFAFLDAVGIGTSTPGALLDIFGTARITNLSIGANANVGSPNQPVKINGVVGNGTNNYGFYDDSTKRFSSSGTESESFSSLYTVDTTASNFNITNVYGFRYRPTIKTGSGTVTNAYGGYFDVPTLATNNFSLLTTGTTVLASNGGNVGIGTTTPLAKFHIQGSVPSLYVISDGSQITGVNSGSTRYEIVQNGSAAYGLTNGLAVDGGALKLGIGAGNSYITGGQQGSSVFNVFVGATSTPKFTVLNNGNVGIGTSTPTRNFSVIGSAHITNTAFIGAVDVGAQAGQGVLNLYNTNFPFLYMTNASSTAGNGFRIGVEGLNLQAYIDQKENAPIVFRTNVAERMRLSANGGLSIGGSTFNTTDPGLGNLVVQNNIGIGTTTPGAALTASGTIQATSLYGGATTLSTDANGNIIRTPSDQKLKTNVETLTSALDKVNQMRGVSYNWIDTQRFGPDKEIGFIAQELETIVPEVVKSGGEYKSVNYQNLTALLTEAIKELSAKFDGFSKKVKTEELCIGETCIKEQELKDFMQFRNSQMHMPVQTPPQVINTEIPQEEPTVETPSEEPVSEPTSTPEPDPETPLTE